MRIASPDSVTTSHGNRRFGCSEASFIGCGEKRLTSQRSAIVGTGRDGCRVGLRVRKQPA